MLSLLLNLAMSQKIHRKCVNKNMVALTIVDGPSSNTHSYLAALKSNGISATFFVVGKQIEKYPGLVKSIYDQGHSIGSHSYFHSYFPQLISQKSIYDEVKKTNNLIYKETQRWTNYFQFPYDAYDDISLNVVQGSELGMTVVQWDVDSSPLHQPAPVSDEESVKNILAPLSKPNAGHIILADETDKLWLSNMDEIITKYKAKGYKFVKMHECLGLKSDYKF
eukprot:NODE_252_length_12846_cov_0.309485.p5 type:complete len:222 gc:universal NODE_252_length_12846_cov_0.309485:2224-1559(-)